MQKDQKDQKVQTPRININGPYNIEMKKYITVRALGYYKLSQERLDKAILEYGSLKPFNPNENIFEVNQNINDDTHLIMKLITQFYYEKMMQGMLINLEDPNVKEDLNIGNIGTAGRVVKTYVGFDTSDRDEMGSGRFAKPVQMASFPNEAKKGIPVIKRCSLVSNCSHHFLAFSSKFRPDSTVIVSYIPDKTLIGISKLSRIVNHISRRFHLQEGLTDQIADAIKTATGTEDVYVGLFNIVHTCESLRGSREQDSGFTTRYLGGRFKDEPDLVHLVESTK